MAWNKERFSIYDSEEKQVLGLIKELGEFTNENTKGLKGKTDLYGDHKGTWQGLNRPTLSDEGMRATVEVMKPTLDKINNEDIPLINNEIDINKTDIKKIDNKLNSLNINVLFPPLGLNGCKGDGVTDDSLALNGIINYLATNGGGQIYFPKGTYILDNVTLKSGISLIGEGRNDNYMTTPSTSILKAKLGATTLFNCNGVDGLSINGLTLEGQDNEKVCYGLIGGGFITVQNCYFRFFKSALGNGIGLQTFIIENNKINQCEIGIWTPVDSRLINNTINANLIGIKLGSGANDNIIAENKIEWNSGLGIEMYQCTSNVISNNIIDRSGNVGINAVNCNNNIISNNVLRRNGATTTTPREMSQLYLEDCSLFNISNNISKVDNTEDNGSGKQSPENGFSIYNSNKINVSNNIIYANSGKCLDAWNSTEINDINNIKNLPQ